MEVIRARNVTEALYKGWMMMERCAENQRESRAGNIIEYPEPVTTVYEVPQERVLYNQERDCNPYFHLMECLWMMAGRNDVEFPAHFVKNMMSFSDDGKTLNGSAYGARWRWWFDYDQLEFVIRELNENPESRRLVMSMWDGGEDLRNTDSKDLPCNLLCVFRVRGESLDLTVYNRSNDVIYGAYGANAVHFSFLLEYVALATGYKVGKYFQVSNSYHIYTDNPKYIAMKAAANNITYYSYYETPPTDGQPVKPLPLFEVPKERDPFDQDLAEFFYMFDNGLPEMIDDKKFESRFFKMIVIPMLKSHQEYKKKRYQLARDELNKMPSGNDWKLACQQWLDRRQETRTEGGE